MSKIDVTGIWPPGETYFGRKLWVATHKKINVVCSECGGGELTLDASAVWDIQAQEWKLSDTMDTCYCNTCGGECNIKEVEVDKP